MKKNLKLKVFGIAFIFMFAIQTIPLVSAFQKNDSIYPKNEIQVLKGDKSKNVLEVFDIIEEDPNIVVSNIDNYNEIFHMNGKLVIIAHGNEDGVHFNNEFITWKDLAEIVDNSKLSVLYLAVCYGGEIKKYIQNPNIKIIGHNGILDSIFAGLLIKTYLNIDFSSDEVISSLFADIDERLETIIENPYQIHALRKGRLTYSYKSTFGVHWKQSMIMWGWFTETEFNNGVIPDGLQFILIGLGLLKGTTAFGLMLAIIGLQLYFISKCAGASANDMDSHGGGAIISFEFHMLPLCYYNIQGRAYDGSIVKSYHIPDGYGAQIIGWALKTAYNNNPNVRYWKTC